MLGLLANPNIASKHWIIRQYDHEVQGGSVIKPLVGPEQDGPGDASVVRPKLDSDRAIALGCGVAPWLADPSLAADADAYPMTLAAMDEAVRNVVCVGADPTQIAILDNFCWPGCDNPEMMASLVHSAEACYDGALAYKTPFVSGKDSLNNQFTTEDGRRIAIPPTMLITALGIVPDAKLARTMDAKKPGSRLILVGPTAPNMGGSQYAAQFGPGVLNTLDARVPRVDLDLGPRTAIAVARLIANGLVASAHDCSDGGLLVAAAEMAIAGRLGLDLHLTPGDDLSLTALCFAESPSRYLLEIDPDHADAASKFLDDANIPFTQVGTFNATDQFAVQTPDAGRVIDLTIDALHTAWRSPLDWS